MKPTETRIHFFRRLKSLCCYSMIYITTLSSAFAGSSDSLLQLKTMSLENLMQITVFSASKKTELLSNVPAAMHVITREEILRSGARTLPDLLRGVPGLSVANMDAHTWAISSRGFNGLFANKLLVLMDGRALYTPLYSGVYWDMQDTLIEDIERIEIIRGPGATIWGANAVNGVINIITRNANETSGLFASAGAGSNDKNSLNVRYGNRGDKLSYRIYAKRLERDNFDAHEGDGEHADSWQNETGGFRIDWVAANRNQIKIQGDIFHGSSEQTTTLGAGTKFETDVDLAGGNLQLQWKKQLSNNASWSLQTYLDRSLRDDWFLAQSRTTWDTSFNHSFSLLDNQSITWGGGYRYTTDHTTGGEYSAMVPASRSNDILNLFIQDDWMLLDDELHLLIGSKVEHNDYSGYEIQPTARILWTPNKQHSFWGSVSYAVRTPSRADSDLVATIAQINSEQTISTPFGPMTVPATTTMGVTGNPEFDSEKLLAYEIGYRMQAHKNFSLDAACFYNIYKDLRTQDFGTPEVNPLATPIQVYLPITIGNNMDGKTYGFELNTNWQARSWWKLSASYSWMKMLLHHKRATGDPIGEKAEEETPEHQASLKSYIDLPHNVKWDTSLFYVDNFSQVPAHLRCDMRLAWSPNPSWEISLKGENLFDKSHREFFDSLGMITSDVPRNWYAEIKYHF